MHLKRMQDLENRDPSGMRSIPSAKEREPVRILRKGLPEKANVHASLNFAKRDFHVESYLSVFLSVDIFFSLFLCLCLSRSPWLIFLYLLVASSACIFPSTVIYEQAPSTKDANREVRQSEIDADKNSPMVFIVREEASAGENDHGRESPTRYLRHFFYQLVTRTVYYIVSR